MSVVRALCAIVLFVTACQPGDAPMPTPVPGGIGQLEVRGLAGPVCPAETEPPDPDCAPRPVAGAPVFVQPGDGRDIIVVEGVTGADGVATFDLPAGEYVVVGGDAEGLMGRPEPEPALVRAHATITVELVWDTGIR